MLKINELSLKEKLRLLLNVCIYIIFIIFMIFSINNTNDIKAKILYSLIMIIFLCIALFSEYMHYMQNSIIDLLNNKYLINDAITLKNKMKKLDVVNGFKGFYVLFDLIIAEEQQDGDTILKILNDNYKKLHGNLDLLLIYRYNMFIAYALLNNHTQMKKAYGKLIELKNAKIKKSKMAPLYNWELIDSIYYYKLNDNKKFSKAINNVNFANMNKREKNHYDFLKKAL